MRGVVVCYMAAEYAIIEYISDILIRMLMVLGVA